MCFLQKLYKASENKNSKFYGDVVLWSGFWDQLSSAIDKNEDLSEIEKFNYLKSFLSGKAEKVIEGLVLE